MSIDYKKNKKADINFIMGKDTKFIFTSILNNKNEFTSIAYTGINNSRYTSFESSLKLDNSRFSGDVKFLDRTYDYEIDGMVDSTLLTGTLTGTLDSENNIDTGNFKYSVKDIRKNINITQWEFSYENEILKIKNNSNIETFSSDLVFTGKWSPVNENFETFDFISYFLSRIYRVTHKGWDFRDYCGESTVSF